MNKKNMIFAASLILSIVTTALPLGEQERGALYDLRAAGHDLRTIGLNSQNVEMFIQLFGMNIEKLEKELEAANSVINSSLIQAGALLGGGQLVVSSLHELSNHAKTSRFGRNKSDQVVDFGLSYGLNVLYSLKTMGSIWSVLNVYDAYKAKKSLTAALALDKEIIAQLLDLKDSLSMSDQPAATVVDSTTNDSFIV